MGADIYLESKHEALQATAKPAFEEAVKKRDAIRDRHSKAFQNAQKVVNETYDAMYSAESYFRDSYNPTSLFWTIGLSWWDDVGDMLEDGFLPIKNAKELLKMLEARPLDINTVKERLKNEEFNESKDSPKKWLEYWSDKRQRIMRMLELSIELNEPLRCSI